MRLRLAVVLAIVLVAGATPDTLPARENEQSVVIGLTLLGANYLDQQDQVRQTYFKSPHPYASVGQLYVEAYPLGDFGVGLLFLQVYDREVRFGSFGGVPIGASETATSLRSDMLTLHYVPWISDSGYTRVSVLAGAGKARYRLSFTGFGSFESDATGRAQLLQVNLDWGGEDFGARTGVGRLATRLGPLRPPGSPALEVDASGTFVFLGLRWAF